MERSLLAQGATLVSLVYMTICVSRVVADVGTAISYNPPYLPTRCPGYDQDRLPESGLFVAAGIGIWDNGAACGRKYQLRCLSGLRRPCKDGSILVQVVDLCRTNPCTSTLVLSDKAFSALSKTQRQDQHRISTTMKRRSTST